MELHFVSNLPLLNYRNGGGKHAKIRVILCTKRPVTAVFGTSPHKEIIPTSVVGRNSVGVALKVRSRYWIYWISTKTETPE